MTERVELLQCDLCVYENSFQDFLNALFGEYLDLEKEEKKRDYQMGF